VDSTTWALFGHLSLGLGLNQGKVGVGATHLEGSTYWLNGPKWRKGTESLPSLSLGTIYIVPLRGRTKLTTRVWVWSLGMGMGRYEAPNPTQLMG